MMIWFFLGSIVFLQSKIWGHAKYITIKNGKRFRGILSFTPLDQAFWISGFMCLFPVLSHSELLELNELKSKINKRLILFYVLIIISTILE